MGADHVPVPPRRIALVATPRGALAALELLRGGSAEVVGVVTHLDASARAPGLAPLISRAKARGVPVLSPRAATVGAAVQWLTHLALDYVVSVGWSAHLTDDMFRVPRHGVVALGPVERPGARLAVRPDWAALRSGTLTGHLMLVLLPSAGTSRAPAQPPRVDDPAAVAAATETYVALARTGHRLLEAERMDTAIGRGGPAMTQVGREGVEHGLGLTSFDRSVVDVEGWVRAMADDGCGALAVLRGERVLIWDCEPAGASDHRLPAGTILGTDGGVVVTTHDGALRLLRVQAPGRETEPAAEWFGRRALPPGCAFDPVDLPELGWLRP